MKKIALFAVVILLIGPSTRSMLSGHLGAVGEWMGAWAPFSYLIVALVFAAPLVAIQMMVTIPKHVEPESAMAKYRREAPPPVDSD